MLVGQQIGPFAIEKELGCGAMGTVYLATYTETGGQVAVKMISPGVAGNPQTVARFERETAILKKLNHPNIVRLFASGRYHRTPFYAMEFIQGESLDRILHRRGRFTWEEVVHLGKQICAALEHAHGQGIVHRDLKPANILMTPDGTAKLADFGIAKGFDSGQLTATNCAVGTAAYMSPEQCRGDKHLTPKSDLYSLGVLFYELLTGRLPFPADNTLDMFLAHTQGDFERPSRQVLDIPVWLDTLVCQCLEKEPDRRPVDAAMIARSLDMVLEKVSAQRSAGVDLLSTRPAQLRKTLKTNQQDLEAARTLHAAIKKTKIRRRTRPFYEKGWVQALGIGLALLVMVGVLVWAFQPPSADSLYRTAQRLMATGNFDTQKQAREGPVKEYLQRYGNSGSEQAAEVQRWADDVDRTLRERQLKTRMKANLSPQDDMEAKAQKAVQHEEAGDFDAASKRWEELAQLKADRNPDAHAWGLLAEKRLGDLQAVEQQKAQLRERIRQARDRLQEPQAESSTESQAILAIRYEVFGDASAALAKWQELRDTLSGNGARPWRLMAMWAIHQLQPKLPSGADAKPTRLALITERLKKATSTKSYNAAESYKICQDIVDLYGQDTDKDVKSLADSARKLKAQRAKEMETERHPVSH